MGGEKAWVFGCVVRAEAQQQALRTPNTHTHINTQRDDTENTPVVTYILSHALYTHTSVSLLRFHRSKRPMPSTAAKIAGCTGDHMTSYT